MYFSTSTSCTSESCCASGEHPLRLSFDGLSDEEDREVELCSLTSSPLAPSLSEDDPVSSLEEDSATEASTCSVLRSSSVLVRTSGLLIPAEEEPEPTAEEKLAGCSGIGRRAAIRLRDVVRDAPMTTGSSFPRV